MQLLITCEVNPDGVERRFDPTTTVDQLKKRLVLVTGVEPDNMQLELKVADGPTHVISADQHEQTLEQLVPPPPHSHIRLHVKDVSGNSTALLQDQSVPKYEMSDEAYEKRQSSLRAFKKEHKLGRFAENASDQPSS